MLINVYKKASAPLLTTSVNTKTMKTLLSNSV